MLKINGFRSFEHKWLTYQNLLLKLRSRWQSSKNCNPCKTKAAKEMQTNENQTDYDGQVDGDPDKIALYSGGRNTWRGMNWLAQNRSEFSEAYLC